MQETYLRGVENRAHREIDRAREESKSRAAQLKEASPSSGNWRHHNKHEWILWVSDWRSRRKRCRA
ncbi:hypothetical protein ACQR3P_04585 [Rhodococcus sp. IEGM1300]